MCQSMFGSAPAMDFAEENIFEVRGVHGETGIERLLAIDVKGGAAADEAIGNDAVIFFVGGKLGFFDGALPDFSRKLANGGVRASLVENFSFVNDGHVGAEVHDVFHDVGGENDDDSFADFGQEVVKAIAFAGV